MPDEFELFSTEEMWVPPQPPSVSGPAEVEEMLWTAPRENLLALQSAIGSFFLRVRIQIVTDMVLEKLLVTLRRAVKFRNSTIKQLAEGPNLHTESDVAAASVGGIERWGDD